MPRIFKVNHYALPSWALYGTMVGATAFGIWGQIWGPWW